MRARAPQGKPRGLRRVSLAVIPVLCLLLFSACGQSTARPTPTLPPFSTPSRTATATLLVFSTSTPPASATPLLAQRTTLTQANPLPAGPAVPPQPWPVSQATPQLTRTFAPSTLTPLAPAAKLENLGEVLRLGNGALLNLAVSADGRLLAFATRRGIFLYDAFSWTRSAFIATAGETPRLAFSPDGAMLAAADRDSRVTLYNSATGNKVRLLDNGALGPPLELSFFSAGGLLYVGSTSEISVIWDPVTGKLVHRWYTSGNSTMAVSADGLLLATSNYNGSIYFWTLEDGKSPGRLYRDSEILAMQFTPDGQALAAGYGDNLAVLWKLDGGKQLHAFQGHTDRVVSVAVSPDSRLVATGSWDTSVRLWDAASGAQLRLFSGHTGRVTQVAFLSDTRLISFSEDGRVLVWNVNADTPAASHDDFNQPGNALFLPDGETLLTGAQDGRLSWWNASTGLQHRTLLAHAGGISALAVSPDGRLVATGGADGRVRVWQTADGFQQYEIAGLESWVNCLAFSADGRFFAASTASGTIRLWETATGRPAYTIETGDDFILRLAFSPDGRSLAAGSIAGSLALWRPGDSQPLRVLREEGPFIAALAFTPDGYSLASGGDEKKITLWRLSGGSQVNSAVSSRAEGASALVYTPDGQLLAAAFWDRTLRFYQPLSGAILRSYDLPAAARQLSISPDGRRLALSLDDGTVRIWGIK